MSDVILLDGSIGQEVVKRSGEAPTPLWSTQVMIEAPEHVRAVHAEYFDVGATIATTNTYAILQDRLDKNGVTTPIAQLWDVAVSMAKEARQSAGHGRVAGGIGPLGASYRPDLAPSPEVAAAQYEDIVAYLDARCDLLLIETVSSIEAAEGVLRATDQGVKPVWIAVSVSDDEGTKLRSGEPVADLLPILQAHRVDAVLINCSRPEVIGAGLDVLKECGKPFGAFGNGFTKISDGFLQDKPTVAALEERHDLTPEAYAQIALSWVDQGASIVGGYCEVGPAHIKELAAQLRAAGHHII